jgi:hypothetical protein
MKWSTPIIPVAVYGKLVKPQGTNNPEYVPWNFSVADMSFFLSIVLMTSAHDKLGGTG